MGDCEGSNSSSDSVLDRPEAVDVTALLIAVLFSQTLTALRFAEAGSGSLTVLKFAEAGSGSLSVPMFVENGFGYLMFAETGCGSLLVLVCGSVSPAAAVSAAPLHCGPT